MQTVLSGPAGGVSGASFVASHAGFDRILTFDMGGTSTDVAVCVSGRPEITRETHVGDFPVRAPAVDVASIGAGGGSIAYVAEATGALRVGPESAGAAARPGLLRPRRHRARRSPTRTSSSATCRRACSAASSSSTPTPRTRRSRSVAEARGTGRRGDRPRDREHGRRGDARRAPRRHRAARPRPERVRARRVRRRRRPARERAREDPRQLPGDRARGVGRALGARVHLVRDQERVQPDVRQEHRGDDARRRAQAVRGAHVACARLARRREASTSPTRTSASSLDMRYSRQGYEMPIELDGVELAALDLAALERRFGEAHSRLYGFVLDGGAEIVNLRVVADGPRPAARSSRRARRAGRTRRRRRPARSGCGRPRRRSTSRPTRAPRSSLAWRSRATRSSSSTTRRRSCSPGTAPSSTRGAISSSGPGGSR